eukprot:1141899-Rhodomonas_salina.1
MVSSSNLLALPPQRVVLFKSLRSACPTARIEVLVHEHYHRIPRLIGISYEARACRLRSYS